METVEMDLMQAQIGSLATDVSRLEAKGKASEIFKVLVSNTTAISQTQFVADIDSDFDTILKKITTSIPVYLHGEYPLGHFATFINVAATSGGEYTDIYSIVPMLYSGNPILLKALIDHDTPTKITLTIINL